TDYYDKDLDQRAFDNMQLYLDELESLGMKSVLRFTYISEGHLVDTQEPTSEQAIRHIEQLAPFIEKNKDLIHVLQVGIVGAWGEWDSGARQRVDEQAIINSFMENTPD